MVEFYSNLAQINSSINYATVENVLVLKNSVISTKSKRLIMYIFIL